MEFRGRDGQLLATQADSRGGEHGMVPSEEVGILDHYAGGIALNIGTVGGPDTRYSSVTKVCQPPSNFLTTTILIHNFIYRNMYLLAINNKDLYINLKP